MRSPLSVTIPGNTALPDQPGPGRDDDLGQARRAVEERVRDVAGGRLPPEGEDLVTVEPRDGCGVPAHDEDVALGDRGSLDGPPSARRPRCRPGSGRGTPASRPPRAGRRCTAIRRGLEAGTARRGAGTARRASARECSGRRGRYRLFRSGSRRRPNSRMIAMLPSRSGIPILENSKKRNGARPASTAASDTSTFTGVPVSASIDPACAENTSGISSCDVGRPNRIAVTTTTGRRAATASVDADQRGQQRRRSA